MKYSSRADLLIAAGESIKMQEAALIREPVCKLSGRINLISKLWIDVDPDQYEFPLAVVKGKPVFVGDKLWYMSSPGNPHEVVFGEAMTPEDVKRFLPLSWEKPKPKTVMVEILVADAEFYAGQAEDVSREERARRVATAFKKALEEMK